jgi:integrase
MQKNLTDRFCKTVAPLPKNERSEFVDTNPNSWNLILRVSKTAKSWNCQYRFNGRRRRESLGTFPTTSLEEARRKSMGIGNLVQQRIDPKIQMKQVQRKELTVGEAVEEYIDEHCKEHQKSWRQTERLLEKYFIARVGEIPLQNLTRANVLELMDDLTDEGLTVQINRVVSQVKAFCNWAVEDREWIDVNPVASINRGKKKRFKESSRDRFLTDEELNAIWEATNTCSQVARSFVRMLLLTGQRRDEVRLMAWDELDIDNGEWKLSSSRTKNKKAHLVLLAPRAIEELRILKNHYEILGIEPGSFVFTVKGKGPFAGLKRLKENLNRDSDVDDWVFHDFRRTFSTCLSRIGIEPRIRRTCLNHSIKDGLDKVYDLYDFQDEKRKAFEAWAGYLTRSVGEINAENVVPLIINGKGYSYY